MLLKKKINIQKESLCVSMHVFYLDFTDETYFIFVSQNLSDLSFMCHRLSDAFLDFNFFNL